MEQKNPKKYSFRKNPSGGKLIDKFYQLKESSLNKREELWKKIPPTIRNIKFSPLNKFIFMIGISGILTIKALKSN